MKYALEVRHGRPSAATFAERLTEAIENAGSAVVDGEGAAPDMVLAVGGDGTMLTAVGRALDHDVPVLGFNLGTLGFLSQAEPGELEEVVGRLLAGDYQIDERMTVAATVGEGTAHGVNDVVVEKVDSQRLVALTVSIDGEEFITYRADGLVVATPTGSTAYAFSAGGPLVDPALAALILTPVASHSLFERALVLPAETEIEVLVAQDREVHVTVDKNDLGRIGRGGVVTIRRGGRPAKFVNLAPRTFSRLVKDKFGLD